jgi:hypothetical protein
MSLVLEEKKIKGCFSEVYNKNAHQSAAPIYYHLNAGGEDYLFTPSQLKEARERASKNQEDLADMRGSIQKFLDWLF